MKTCTIQGCENDLLALGLCRKHYLRNYRNGSPHIVKSHKEYMKTGPGAANFKHGFHSHPLYKTWKNIQSRCKNPFDSAYANYGGRGITVCKRWDSIQLFIEDMGERPAGTSIDRIDNNAGYEPGNCRWADRSTQNRNRRYAKLTLEKAHMIRDQKKNGMKRQEIADNFGVSVATVKKVLSGAYWKDHPNPSQ